MAKDENRKKVAVEFLRLAASGKADEGKHFFARECKHHNPFFPADMNALLSAMVDAAKSFSDGRLVIKSVMADGDLVAVHAAYENGAGKLGMVQVHLFRFSGEKIVEYWDVTQMAPENSPNVNGMV